MGIAMIPVRNQGMVQVQVGAHHATGCVVPAGMLVGFSSIYVAPRRIVAHSMEYFLQMLRIIVPEKDGRLAPKLPEGWNVTGDNRATGERSFQRSKPERLILRSGRIDR